MAEMSETEETSSATVSDERQSMDAREVDKGTEVPVGLVAHDELFLKDLTAFYASHGQPLPEFRLNHKSVSLDILWALVQKQGGYEEGSFLKEEQPLVMFLQKLFLSQACKKKRWASIGRMFGIPNTFTNASFSLRSKYSQYLIPYEKYLRGEVVQLAPMRRRTENTKKASFPTPTGSKKRKRQGETVSYAEKESYDDWDRVEEVVRAPVRRGRGRPPGRGRRGGPGRRPLRTTGDMTISEKTPFKAATAETATMAAEQLVTLASTPERTRRTAAAAVKVRWHDELLSGRGRIGRRGRGRGRIRTSDTEIEGGDDDEEGERGPSDQEISKGARPSRGLTQEDAAAAAAAAVQGTAWRSVDGTAGGTAVLAEAEEVEEEEVDIDVRRAVVAALDAPVAEGSGRSERGEGRAALLSALRTASTSDKEQDWANNGSESALDGCKAAYRMALLAAQSIENAPDDALLHVSAGLVAVTADELTRLWNENSALKKALQAAEKRAFEAELGTALARGAAAEAKSAFTTLANVAGNAMGGGGRGGSWDSAGIAVAGTGQRLQQAVQGGPII